MKNLIPCFLMLSATAVIFGQGNVGIGVNAPHAPLHFSNTTGNRKIILYEVANNDHQFFGLGVELSGTFRYQTPVSANDHAFYSGVSASTSKELMRIKGNGNVGIGSTLFDYKLSVTNNFGVDNSGSIHLRNMPRQIYFYEDGLPSKMILSHSPSYPTWGLQYTGAANTFRFLADSNLVMGVNLGANTVEVAGKLGVGTPGPSEKLEVAGIIYTSEGGIRFPDETLQTTAAFNSDPDPSSNASAKGKINMFIIHPDFNDTMQVLDLGGGIRNIYSMGPAGHEPGATETSEFRIIKEMDQFSARITQHITIFTDFSKVRFYYTNTDGKTYHVIELRQVGLSNVNYRMVLQPDGTYAHIEEINLVAGAIESSFYDPAVTNPLTVTPDYCYCYNALTQANCTCDNN